MTRKPARRPDPDLSDRKCFVATFGGVYEHSPWIAQLAFEALKPSEARLDLSTVVRQMASIVDDAGDELKLALLRAHPDLAGRLAIKGKLTSASRSEQVSAGLDQCSPEEWKKFQDLNGAYLTKFGFPFIIAVSELTREEILKNFEMRIQNSRESEFRTALQEVHKIASIRLAKIFNERA